jgi:protein-S-isoprenylcysteine O-methyltransferase Ste14
VGQGVYRHVRNLMISGVFFVLFGEAVLAASLPVFCWFVIVVIGGGVYIRLAEEPGLVKPAEFDKVQQILATGSENAT